MAGRQIYIEIVAKSLKRKKDPKARALDPRHVLGYIELTGMSFSNMSDYEWRREINTGVACALRNSKEASEKLAQSYCL